MRSMKDSDMTEMTEMANMYFRKIVPINRKGRSL